MIDRLVAADGTVRLGIFSEAVAEVNYRDFDLTDPFGNSAGRWHRHFGFKQFAFLGALAEPLVFGCAVADVKYVGTAFVYLYEPVSRRLREYSFRRPFGLGVHFDQAPESGTVSFRSHGTRIEMRASVSPPQRRLQVALDDGVAIDAVFDEGTPPIQPMFICTQTGATGWVYARKTAGVTVSGSVRWKGRTFDLAAIRACGHHDWSAGYMRRETFWKWGCLAGRLPDGRAVGMNVSCGVNETSFTENCMWVDGELHKLDTVHFEHDRRDLMQPWRVSSYDGRLQLQFHPQADHKERVNAWVVASNFNQLVGRYDGWFEPRAGERLQIDGLLGYAERHYAKW